MQNMVGHIDGCHIPLYENLIKGKTYTLKYFYNQKNFHSLLITICMCF